MGGSAGPRRRRLGVLPGRRHLGGQAQPHGFYGFSKSLGYTAGPLLGGGLVALGGLPVLFAVMAALAMAVAVWAGTAVPVVSPLPRPRQTLVDLARRLGEARFLRPTAALAAATAALSAGVGFLPVSGAAVGLGPMATGAAVSVLAATAAFIQPVAGRALDAGRITTGTGIGVGVLLTAAGLGTATVPGLAGVLGGAFAVGAGTGLITPVAFAALARATPQERLGQTMGAAEVGRELGDAGGPLLIAAVASTATLAAGYAALALLMAATFPFLTRRTTD